MDTVQITVNLSQDTANLLLMMSVMTRESVAEILEKAANEFVLDHLKKKLAATEKKSEEAPAAPDKKEKEPKVRLIESHRPFEGLDLSVRSFNLLRRFFDSEEEALVFDRDPADSGRGLRNLGVRSAREIAIAFKVHGYKVEGTVWEKYLTYDYKPSPKPIKPVYLADEEEFIKLHLHVREMNILRINFRSIDEVLAFKEDPLSIRRVGDTAAQRIARALQGAGYVVHGTVWEKYL